MTSSSTLAAAPILTVNKLSIRSGDRQLLDNVSFSINAGERVGLIGESGSGKSLTSLAIFGLLPEGLHAAGEVRLKHVEFNVVTASERQLSGIRGDRIAMVFQDPMTALNPTMKIGAQVAEALEVHSSRRASAYRADALDLLKVVDLPQPERAFGAYPHELSGGQRQRVALAIAMANRPSLLVCDEPTTALDVTVQARMLALIEDAVVRNESALLFITHDLAVVATLCEKVIVMFGGEMLEMGSVHEVFENPRHPYTRALVTASALTKDPTTGRLPTIPENLFSYREAGSRCERCSHIEGSRGAWIDTATGGYACWHEELMSR